MNNYIKKELVLFVLIIATNILSAQEVVLKMTQETHSVNAEVVSLDKDTLNTPGKFGRFDLNRDALRPYMCKAFGAAFSPEEQEKLRGFVRDKKRIFLSYYFLSSGKIWIRSIYIPNGIYDKWILEGFKRFCLEVNKISFNPNDIYVREYDAQKVDYSVWHGSFVSFCDY